MAGKKPQAARSDGKRAVGFENGLVYESPMTTPRRLADEDFANVVRLTPLVSIDIIITCPQETVLLGYRVNEPARGTYFVPGGIILKNEPIREAFARILKNEIGLQESLDHAVLLGVSEHFYATNRFENPEYGTHYVAIGYELNLKQRPPVEMDSQHSNFQWIPKHEILSAPNIHENTKAYFR
jgi:colanic acid biosynthesis protein WcaH